MYTDFRMLVETMLVVRDEAGRKDASLQRLKYL